VVEPVLVDIRRRLTYEGINIRGSCILPCVQFISMLGAFGACFKGQFRRQHHIVVVVLSHFSPSQGSWVIYLGGRKGVALIPARHSGMILSSSSLLVWVANGSCQG
jgi:hypothetical protein